MNGTILKILDWKDARARAQHCAALRILKGVFAPPSAKYFVPLSRLESFDQNNNAEKAGFAL